MDDTERDDSSYHPAGVPLTPQARRFGYEFPVYCSQYIWKTMCVASGVSSKRNTNTEKRINHLLQYCYDGMIKKLATQDDFVFYEFKVYFWDRSNSKRTKMIKEWVGARLLLDPSTEGPWLYIFSPFVDKIDTLTKNSILRALADQVYGPGS